MRFKEFLNEALTEDKIKIIKRDCKDFLQQTDVKHPLYRGMWSDDVPKTFIPIKVIKNRYPRNSKKEIHELFNTGFINSKFKIKARSETLFCSGDRHVVEQYGDRYMVFPIGKFDVIWSPFINDLFMDDFKWYIDKVNLKDKKDFNIMSFIIYHAALKYYSKQYLFFELFENFDMKEIFKFYNIDFYNVDYIIDGLKKHVNTFSTVFINTFYKKGELKKAIESGNEIMIKCDSYYALEYYSNSKLWNLLFK